jgi:hypothetical protein
MSLLIHPAIDPSSSVLALPANSSRDSIHKLTDEAETVEKNGRAIARRIVAEDSLHDDGSVKQAFPESTANDRMPMRVSDLLTAFLDANVDRLSPIKQVGHFGENVF